MDNNYIVPEEKLTSLANNVRAITKTEDSYSLDEINSTLAGIAENGVGTDTTDATAQASDILKGETAYVANGKVTGTFTLDNELTTQDDLISQIQTALEGKAGGIILPTLTNPGTAENLEEGYELIDGDGNIVTGTHVCSSSGGTSSTLPTVSSGFVQSTSTGSVIYAYNTLEGITTGSYSLTYLSAAKRYRHALAESLIANTPIIVLTSGTITMPPATGYTLETIATGTGYGVYQYTSSGSGSSGEGPTNPEGPM